MFNLFVVTPDEARRFPYNPAIKPLVILVDHNEKVKKLKRNPYGSLDPDPAIRNYYPRQYLADEIFFGEGVETSVDLFVGRFMDGVLKHNYLSE